MGYNGFTAAGLRLLKSTCDAQLVDVSDSASMGTAISIVGI